MQHLAHSGNVTISYEVDGPPDAPAILFINAIGTTREMWGRQVPAFAATYRVIRYDARGHGQSSVPDGDYAIEQLGQDALAVLDAAGVPSAHVCGISLGGLTAMWLGVHAASRVSSLVLANTAARIGTLTSWEERIALVREGGMSAVADRAIPLWFTPAFRDRDRDTVHGFRAMIQSCPLPGYLGCCAALRDADLRPALAQIACPVLVIGATEDTATPLTEAQRLHEAVSDAEMLTLHSAHLSNVEQADAFTSALLEFVA